MSKPLTPDATALLTVAEAVLEDYFANLPLPLPADASKELKRLYAYIAKRKNPPQPRPRKPKQAVDTPPASGNVALEVPDGLKVSEHPIQKRSKR